jgi:hypothetical protein
MTTYSLVNVAVAASVALLSVACGGSDDPITAESVTLEQCEEIFDPTAEAEEPAEGEDEPVEGDFDADGDADEDDTAIEERCDELMEGGDSSGSGGESAE